MLWRSSMGALLFATLAVSRALAITVTPGFSASVYVAGLDEPTAAAFAPDGRLVVLQKSGAVRLWTAADGLRAAPLLTLPVCTASEMGLLGIVFDPGFATNGFLYLYYTHPPGGVAARCNEGTDAGRVNRVVRVTLGTNTIDPASLVVLVDGLRTDNGNHDGGALRIGTDGLLYIGTGDTGRGDSGPPGASTNPYAHDLQHLEGKILRVALDGSAPADNPFVAMGGDAARVWAFGFRNPFRFAFDPIVPGPGHLWVGDVGQNTWEEIDVVAAGDDLGWPQCEGHEPAAQCPGDSVPPVHVYRHPGDPGESVSVTGGVHYDGAQFEDRYRGDYFFGDYGLDKVYRMRVNATRDGFMGERELFASDAGNPVEFIVGPDGALYWVAIGLGAIVRVTQDGRPGAGIGGCERALGRAAAGWLPRIARKSAMCFARVREDCLPPAPPRASRRVRRSMRRACDAAALARVCARFGCVPCASMTDLLACATRATAATVGTVIAPLATVDPSRCSAAVARAGGVASGARLDAIVACADTGAAACVPPPLPPEPPAERLVRPCRELPTDLCTSLACTPCATSTDLARCIAARGAEPIDGLASTMLGIVR